MASSKAEQISRHVFHKLKELVLRPLGSLLLFPFLIGNLLACPKLLGQTTIANGPCVSILALSD